jgi:hypothetical protein
MTDEAQANAPQGRNIVILSDGTGQRGGVYFDEARINIYKLYRATRSAPDSTVPAARQVAFYDPGLGTQTTDGGFGSRLYRTVYNYVSQATGLGITRNIIDCYAAIIEIWRPGDRIFLFGFSRGADTVRCLAAALCQCGIPTRGWDGGPLKCDPASAQMLASRAVKSANRHLSARAERPPRDRSPARGNPGCRRNNRCRRWGRYTPSFRRNSTRRLIEWPFATANALAS